MVYYIPCNYKYLSDILKLFYKHTNTQSSYEQEQVFLELIDNSFCKHINKKGLNKFCLIKNKKNNIFCKKHNIVKQFQPLCNGITKYGKNCKQKSKKNSNFCHYHEKKNIKNNTFVYKCNIGISQLFLLENTYAYKSEIVKKQYNIFDINSIMNKYNLLYIDLLYILNLFCKLTSQKSKKTENGWVNSCDKQLILYENKVIPKVNFLENIYDYINKYNYETFIKSFKKYNFSKIYENIYYDEIQKNRKKLKNKKKKLKQKEKKKIEKNKPKLEISYININTKYVEKKNYEHIFLDDSFCFKKFPFVYKIYKNNISFEILYFHCFINIYSKDIPKVMLFYREENKLKYIIITYKELYELLIKIYNKESVLDFIKKYFINFSP